jgi:hypothetical protein
MMFGRSNTDIQTIYKRVFCNSDGKLTEDAMKVLQNLGELCSAETALPASTTNEEMRQTEGARQVYHHILTLLGMSFKERELIRNRIVKEQDENYAHNKHLNEIWDGDI